MYSSFFLNFPPMNRGGGRKRKKTKHEGAAPTRRETRSEGAQDAAKRTPERSRGARARLNLAKPPSKKLKSQARRSGRAPLTAEGTDVQENSIPQSNIQCSAMPKYGVIGIFF